jgi:hypothetical protein
MKRAALCVVSVDAVRAVSVLARGGSHLIVQLAQREGGSGRLEHDSATPRLTPHAFDIAV